MINKSHYNWCRILDCLLIVAKGDSKEAIEDTKRLLYKLEHYWDKEK